MKKIIAIIVMFLICSMSFVAATQMSLIYDANGNLVTGDGMFREYNELNKLVSVKEGDTVGGNLLEEYTWHPVEDRVLVKHVYSNNSWVETVIYVNENYVQVKNATGTFDYNYIFHNGQMVSQRNDDGSKYYMHDDHLGSVSLVTNSNGDSVEETTYAPFGEIISGGETSRFDFTGKEFSSVVGDYDFNARRMDPEWGRFVQPDPVAYDLRFGRIKLQAVYDPQNLNSYAYAKNNPYVYVDPNGLWVLTVGQIHQVNLMSRTYSLGYGVAYSYDPEYGIQSGYYCTDTKGEGFGIPGASSGWNVGYEDDARQIKDIEGTQEYGGYEEGALSFSGSYYYGQTSESDPSFLGNMFSFNSLDYGSHQMSFAASLIPSTAGGYSQTSNTKTATIYGSGRISSTIQKIRDYRDERNQQAGGGLERVKSWVRSIFKSND